MSVSPGWTGTALALGAAVLLSGTSISAVVSFGGGASPSSAILVRFLGAIIVLYALLRHAGAPMRLRRRDRTIAIALGTAQAAQSYFLYTSFAHIPVGLTMIIFYVYPLLVGMFASAIGQDRLTGPLVAGLIVAFVGLSLIFDVTGAGLNLVGALSAVLAAVFWSLVIVLSARLFGAGDSRPVTLHVQVSALVFFAVFLAFSGDVQLPATPAGWTGYLLLPVLYGVAIASFFAATSILGSVRPSLIMNFEPVSTIILGYLILGQTLTPRQLLGAAFVLLALVAVGWDGRRQRGRA